MVPTELEADIFALPHQIKKSPRCTPHARTLAMLCAASNKQVVTTGRTERHLSSGRFLGLFTRQRMKEKKEGAGRLAREAWSTCPPGANWAVGVYLRWPGSGQDRVAASFLPSHEKAGKGKAKANPSPASSVALLLPLLI